MASCSVTRKFTPNARAFSCNFSIRPLMIGSGFISRHLDQRTQSMHPCPNTCSLAAYRRYSVSSMGTVERRCSPTIFMPYGLKITVSHQNVRKHSSLLKKDSAAVELSGEVTVEQYQDKSGSSSKWKKYCCLLS